MDATCTRRIESRGGELDASDPSEGAFRLIEGHVIGIAAIRLDRPEQACEGVDRVGGIHPPVVGSPSHINLDRITWIDDGQRVCEANSLRNTASFSRINERADALEPGASLVSGDEFNGFAAAGFTDRYCAQKTPGQ